MVENDFAWEAGGIMVDMAVPWPENGKTKSNVLRVAMRVRLRQRPALGRRNSGLATGGAYPACERNRGEERDQGSDRDRCEYVGQEMVILIDAREGDEHRNDKQRNPVFGKLIRQWQEQTPEKRIVSGRKRIAAGEPDMAPVVTCDDLERPQPAKPVLDQPCGLDRGQLHDAGKHEGATEVTSAAQHQP